MKDNISVEESSVCFRGALGRTTILVCLLNMFAWCVFNAPVHLQLSKKGLIKPQESVSLLFTNASSSHLTHVMSISGVLLLLFYSLQAQLKQSKTNSYKKNKKKNIP